LLIEVLEDSVQIVLLVQELVSVLQRAWDLVRSGYWRVAAGCWLEHEILLFRHVLGAALIGIEHRSQQEILGPRRFEIVDQRGQGTPVVWSGQYEVGIIKSTIGMIPIAQQVCPG